MLAEEDFVSLLAGATMSINALSAASGADLLQRFQQPDTPVATPSTAVAKVLKTALSEAQLSESSLVGGGPPDTSGALLNVQA